MQGWMTLGRIGALLALALAGAGCATLTPAQLDLGGLDRELTRLERRGMVGHVLVARHGTLVYSRGVGAVDPSTGDRATPIGSTTVFPLLSLTKPFTASAILALAADGQISIDDAIGRHLPELASPWADIPVHALLTHTAGVSPQIASRDWSGEPLLEPITRETFLGRVQQFPPQRDGATAFRYSNVGYGLLGALIESVTGRSFERYLRERLLAPAGLVRIAFHDPQWSVGEVVTGRVAGRAHWRYIDQPMLPDGAGFNLRASGELHASADDVLAWWRALRAGNWLPDEWMDEWLTPRVREPDGSRYGYGWQFRETRAGLVIGHTGGDRVYSVDFSWYPDLDLLIHVTTADARWQADLLRDRLHRRLLRAN
jgi:CubicO group peptidase (beta-lactamase class C family)